MTEQPKPAPVFSVEDKLRELRTELMWRHKVYKARVRSGKMTPELARRKISILNQIIADYERGTDLFSPIGDLR